MRPLAAAVQVVGRLTVLVEVDALDLVLLGDAPPDGVLDRQGDHERGDAGPRDGHEDTEGLVDQGAEAAAVEQTVDGAAGDAGPLVGRTENSPIITVPTTPPTRWTPTTSRESS